MGGKQPYWPDNLMKRHIQPVAKANGIHKDHRVAYFPAFPWHLAEGKRRGCQNRSRKAAEKIDLTEVTASIRK
jgi:hypothetical protein